MEHIHATKRGRGRELESIVSTFTIPQLGFIRGIFVLGDGSRLFSTSKNIIFLQLPPSGMRFILAGDPQVKEGGFQDGENVYARLNVPGFMALDMAGNVLFSDTANHAIRSVHIESSVVSTLAGGRQVDNEDNGVVYNVLGNQENNVLENRENHVENDQKCFADGQGARARFNKPMGLVVAPNGSIYVSDSANHAIRVITPAGSVRTLCGNGHAGYADGKGADARFNNPCGLAWDADENLLVADAGNNAIRRVTIAGQVSTFSGNGVPGFADGVVAAARFNRPVDIRLDGKGSIIVADMNNHRLRKIAGGLVTTIAGSKCGLADGPGAVAQFSRPCALTLDERGRVLVAEYGRQDTFRLVEASLVPPLWMDSEEEAAGSGKVWKTHRHRMTAERALEDYGKILDNGDLTDVALVVGGERFLVHSCILSARSEYFRGMFRSEMHTGISKDGQVIEEVSAEAFRTVLRYLYKAELPDIAKGVADAGRGTREERSIGVGDKGKGKGKVGKGAGGDWETSKENGEDTTRRMVFERQLLIAADLFQLEELSHHCVKQFQQGLKEDTVVAQLVWAHIDGPADTRTVSREFLFQHKNGVLV